MATYAVIENSKVVNLILANKKSDYPLTSGQLLIQSDSAKIGDTWNGTSFTAPAPPPPLPDWAGFNRQMIVDAGYNRIATTTSNQRAVSRLETIVVPAGYLDGVDTKDYPLIKACWDSIIVGVPLLGKATAIEIANWNAIALNTFMQFQFDSDGKMVLVNS
ncbi:hypothetical protein LC605_24125 [Nostoc sp. CHAB 5836]|uniref:hypothetical protein n=1 Tax=Nostoc sp. CHAB 5836 TaxID=2780404 RepID=UPI001E30CB8F|nr:hypothetical protein [Nostoc sp. CHAB 5836]MCC5618116.1 hypothetical protein [Nostoc sp. CHAB 5836]